MRPFEVLLSLLVLDSQPPLILITYPSFKESCGFLRTAFAQLEDHLFLVHGCQFRDLKASAEQLMKAGAPEGLHLEQALAILAELSVPAEARVRHGLVIDEILAEIYEGDHDIVVVGSRSTSGWRRFLLDDQGQQIIDCTDRPVLAVRT